MRLCQIFINIFDSLFWSAIKIIDRDFFFLPGAGIFIFEWGEELEIWSFSLIFLDKFPIFSKCFKFFPPKHFAKFEIYLKSSFVCFVPCPLGLMLVEMSNIKI